MAKDNEVLFELHGLTVRANTVYTVQHRLDMSAPSGFIQHGATKLPSAGVGDTFYCRWRGVEGAPGLGVWDTGFYFNSPLYEGLPDKEVNEKVENLIKTVVEPYRRSVGNDTAFDQAKDPDSIETTAFRVWEGKQFRTSDPVQVMELYFSLLTRHIVTSENEGDTTFDTAAYRIIDIDDAVSRKEEVATQEFEAIGEFQKLLHTDKNKLFKILLWEKVNVDENMTHSALQSLFKQRMGDKAKVNSFLQTVEDCNKKQGQEKIEIFAKLKDQWSKGDKITKTPGGLYFYKEMELGSSLRNAAENISKQKNLKEFKQALLLGDDD